jgi:hypothetical protein
MTNLPKRLRDKAHDLKSLRQGLGPRSPFLKSVEDLLREAANKIEDLDNRITQLEDDETEREEGKDF